MGGKLRNYGIIDYVHLTYEGAIEDGRLRKKWHDRDLRRTYRNRYRELERNFESVVGISSVEFLKRAKKSQEQMIYLNKIVTAESFSELKKLLDSEQLNSFNAGTRALNQIVSASKMISYSNMLGKIYTGKGKDILKDFSQIGRTFKDFNIYESYLKGLNDNKRGARSENEKKALLLYLLTEIAKETKQLQTRDGKRSLVRDFKWSDSSIDELMSNAENYQKAFKSGHIPTNQELDKSIKHLKEITDKNIKGALVGEYNAGLVSKLFMPMVLGEITDKINVAHVGTKIRNKKNVVYELPSLYEKVLKEVEVIDKKADILVKYSTPSGKKEVPISVKTYKSSAKWVNVAASTTLGAALSFGKNGANTKKLYMSSGIRGRLFNAINFYLLEDDFESFLMEDWKGIGIRKTSVKRPRTITAIDNAFGKILSNMMIEIISNYLDPETNAFLLVNNTYIPTPIYYKYMMKKFLINNRITINKHFVFSKSNYNKEVSNAYINGAFIASITENEKGYDYLKAAYDRNKFVGQQIMNNQVSIRTDFIKPEDLKKLIK